MGTNKNNWYKRLGWAGITLCGLCCALPIIGTAIGIASLTAISVYAEKISILAFGIAAFFFGMSGIASGRRLKPAQPVTVLNAAIKPKVYPRDKE